MRHTSSPDLMWTKLIDMSFCNSVHPLPNENFPHKLVGAKILDLKLVGQYFIFIKIFNRFKFTH